MKVKSIIKKQLTESFFHESDWLFRGFTFEDLITTLESNESEINPQVVMKVFKELHKDNYEDALHGLKQQMNFIIKKSKG
jgi:hypothetical protein